MLALALTALVAATPLTPESMEKQAALHVVREFERVGRRAPVQDKALTEAARRLAREALGPQMPNGAPDLHALTLAVSDSGGADPSPRSLIIRAWEHSQAIDTFLARQDFNTEPTTHYGVGVVTAGERAALLLLMADRKAELVHFPRNYSRPGSTQVLCGELATPLRSAEVYVTLPDGNVQRVPLTRETGPRFCSQLRFLQTGAYTVEVIGRATKGPEVAALFLVDVGGPRERGEQEPGFDSEPTTVPEAREALLSRINNLRKAHKLPPLAPAAALDTVAQKYSERMAREGFFAHVAPDGSDLRKRLEGAGPAYRSAGENLGLAPGPLSAHFGIEHSPGHRKNLLSPQFTHVGIGVAFQTVEGRPQAIVTEVFSSAGIAATADPLVEAYKALDAKRAERKLPPLERSEVLEQIAMDHVRRALKQDTPKAHLPDSRVHDRVFRAMVDVATTAVDFYVAEDPTTVPESKSLLDARNTQVGVGIIRGDSQTFGRGKYWVVVIYTTPR
ncbi:CAP domain-containing protein [Hyalangium rubrum]|uniref:CAP domain-containing protein n=1 Tax=Hyalangium rubrum TaxID=3103134 RepID=A0ABU5H575_9BACT|nr:CAP domain-containing protein [Hyalangium sp. s54d21]MDY7227922.1 CAP domain-containing protein [Hyalangium sp. s54d21]